MSHHKSRRSRRTRIRYSTYEYYTVRLTVATIHVQLSCIFRHQTSVIMSVCCVQNRNDSRDADNFNLLLSCTNLLLLVCLFAMLVGLPLGDFARTTVSAMWSQGNPTTHKSDKRKKEKLKPIYLTPLHHV